MARGKSRPERLAAAIADICEGRDQLQSLQEEYQEWRDNMPENLEGSTLAEKLDTVIDLIDTAGNDIENAVNEVGEAELPRGFGKD